MLHRAKCSWPSGTLIVNEKLITQDFYEQLLAIYRQSIISKSYKDYHIRLCRPCSMVSYDQSLLRYFKTIMFFQCGYIKNHYFLYSHGTTSFFERPSSYIYIYYIYINLYKNYIFKDLCCTEITNFYLSLPANIIFQQHLTSP